MPACVGVPVSTPAALNAAPAGSVPVLAHVYGVFPPVAANVVANELPSGMTPRLPELVIVSAAYEMLPE